jgi:hypothetical protein
VPADFTLGLTMLSIAGHYNRGMYAGQFQEADAEFATLLQLIRALQQARCPFHKYTASSCWLASFPRTRESRRRGHGDWMPAYAGMTFYWCRPYETDI